MATFFLPALQSSRSNFSSLLPTRCTPLSCSNLHIHFLLCSDSSSPLCGDRPFSAASPSPVATPSNLCFRVSKSFRYRDAVPCKSPKFNRTFSHSLYGSFCGESMAPLAMQGRKQIYRVWTENCEYNILGNQLLDTSFVGGHQPWSKTFRSSFHVRAVANPVELETGFKQMIADTKRKYYMLGGKGGVGKTSLAASLAVKFANNGHSTLVVSTDPAHSLGDSFAQDFSGGNIVSVVGTDAPLFALEINPEQARAEFRASTQKDGSSGVKDFMDSVGLGGWVEQLGELKLGELLDTPPPGLDEAIAISKVVQFIQAPEYQQFTRIIFDTAPTGHTLRLLSLPDFLDASIGKILKLKQKLASATAAIKSVFGQGDGNDNATDKLELLRERMVMVREIFRDKSSTEFIIVTIPTVMAVSESSRLHESLHKEGVPVKRLIINQLLPPSSSDCKFCSIKRKDQSRAMDLVKKDPNLKELQLVESPLFDVEIRGVPALRFMGDIVWQ